MMDFVIDSCLDDDNSEASTSPEPGMGFSFITDDVDDTNILEGSDSDAEKDEIGEEESKPSNQDKFNYHPLAHLFDEPEVEKTKCFSQSPKNHEKKKGSKDKYVPFPVKFYEGLSNNSNKKILPLMKNRKSEIDKFLEKSELLNTNMEEQTLCIQPPLSKRKLKKLKKQEMEKTKGDKWFGLPATEVTEELKRDLEIMQMRSVLDPKHFYKKNHMKVLPKYFHVGTVQDSPLDYYNNRLTKKERKRTLVDQLMSDAEFNHYNKSKYAEILKEKRKTEYKIWKQGRRMDRKKKYN